MDAECGQYGQTYDGCCQHIEFQTAFAKRGEKRRADLQTNRIDKQNQAKILGKRFYMWFEPHAEMRKQDAHEENPRYTQ